MSTGVSKKEPSHTHARTRAHTHTHTHAHAQGKTVTVHGAPRRRKAYIQSGAASFPKGIVNDTAISTPVPCRLRHDTFHLGLGRQEPCYIVCRSNPHQGIPSTNVTAFHVTQVRVEYESTLPQGTDEGLDLWQARRLGYTTTCFCRSPSQENALFKTV